MFVSPGLDFLCSKLLISIKKSIFIANNVYPGGVFIIVNLICYAEKLNPRGLMVKRMNPLFAYEEIESDEPSETRSYDVRVYITE